MALYLEGKTNYSYGLKRGGHGVSAGRKIERIAEAYALDPVDVAQKRFGVTLDFSDATIKEVESILKRLHEMISQAKPKED